MDGKQRSYYFEVFLISAAALLIEINYTRIFSYKIYYFFTYFIIGLALLGFGSAGVFVAIIPRLRRFSLDSLFYVCSLAGSLSVLVGYLVVSLTPTETLHVFTTIKQPVILVLISLSVYVTFLLIGIIISALFSQRPKNINRIYFADLLGAGAASGAAVPLMAIFTPPGCIFIAGLLLAVTGLIVGARRSKLRLFFAIPFVLLLAAGVVRPGLGVDVLPDLTKGIDKGEGTVTHAFGWSPVFRVDAQPLTVEFHGQQREILALFHDGMLGSTIVNVEVPIEDLKGYDVDSRGIPYGLLPPDPKVLIIGAAGGHEILAGLNLGVRDITAVELNPVTYSMLTETFFDFSGQLVGQPGVRYILDEGRTFIARQNTQYDLIYFVAPDSYSAMNASTSGAFVLSESYLYTVEAIMDTLRHITKDGLICMQFGEFNYDNKPTRTARYVSTAREAFRRMGVDDFSKHVIVTTSADFVSLSTVLLKKTPFSEDEIRAIDEVANRMEKTIVRHAPDRQRDGGAVNVAIELPHEELADWFRRNVYDVSPVTDDKPFFWHFKRFRDISLFEASEPGIDKESGFGERVLELLFWVSIAFGAVFLLLPFVAVRATWKVLPYKLHSLVYFGALGLGFMFYEISLIQKLTLFLGYPTYSLTVTLMTVLVFAGVGSMLSEQFAQRRQTMLMVLLLVLFGATIFHQFATGPLILQWIALPLAFRVAISVLFVAPMALCLGAFLPIGLTAFSEMTEHKGEYIAWCWAMNGFFSVIGSVLSTMLAMSFGFRALMTLAFLVYVAAFAAISALPRPGEST